MNSNFCSTTVVKNILSYLFTNKTFDLLGNNVG